MGSRVEKVRVWDPLIRIFHWTLVAAFTIAYFTDDEDLLLPHVWAGYVIIGLLVFRVIWGLVGTTHARFSDFVFAPTVVISFLRETLKGQAKRYLGHNPAGGWMVILLLVMLSLISITGLVLYGVDEHAGPLAGFMAGTGEDVKDIFEELHEFFANFTLFLVIIHLAGVAMESILHRENLVQAMVTGYKRGDDVAPEATSSAEKGISQLGRFFAVSLVLLGLGVLGWSNGVMADIPQGVNLQKNVNKLVPLESLIDKAESQHIGRLIEAELKSIDGRDIYEIEILDESGKVWETFYDARSGEPIKYEEEEKK